MVNGVSTQTTQMPLKPVVGVLIDSVDSYFLTQTVEDLLEAAEDQNLHLVFYFGGFLEKGKTAGPYSYAYTLPDPEDIKALIVLPHSIAPWDPYQAVNLMREQFPDIPFYSLFANTPGCCSAYSCEENATQTLIHHLVEEHGYKRFAVMLGPNSPNSISNERQSRINGLLSGLQIGLAPVDVFEDNFTIEDGKTVARKILERVEDAPELLICMNDQAALGAIKEFQENGIFVPEDIAVVGFDDIVENTSIPCTFTTVTQPGWELVNALVERIASDLSGKSSYAKEPITLNAQFVHRESCGCTSWFEKPNTAESSFIPQDPPRSSHGTLKRAAILRRTLEDIVDECISTNDASQFEEFIHQAIRVLSQSGDLTNSFIDIFSTQWTVSLLKYPEFNSQILINSLFVDAFRLLIQMKTKNFARIHNNDLGALRFYQNSNALLGQKLTVYKAMKAIGSNLPQLGIQRCAIIFIRPDNPEIGEIRLSYHEGQFTNIPETAFVQIPIKKLIENGISSISEPVGVLTIAHENSVYGYIVLSISEQHYDQFTMVQKMVSQIIDAAMTNELLSSHIQTLTQKNDILSRMSIVDEFTGLFNRRALYVSGRNMYQHAIDRGSTSCFIFLDMDGLKAINDTYGHKQGDAAILALANILKKSFRENDLVVRYGGDEFVVLMTNIQEETMHKALSRISENINEFNGKKMYDWTLSVSWGYVFNEIGSIPKSFESIIEESDAHLYQEKRKKKGLA
jgi:diguanylate cyclase (GGDEF)-like protein